MSARSRAVARNSLLLAGFAALTAALLAGTFAGTEARIAQARRAAQEQALRQILPRAGYDNILLDDRITLPRGDPLLGIDESTDLYLARRRGIAQAVLVPALAADGYGGAIELIVGVNRDGRIAGVRVVAHRETPGLGDAIDPHKSAWLEALRGKSLGNPEPARWTVRKDGGAFDQFTGASVTPRAVLKATARALEYVGKNRERLFSNADRREAPQP